MTEYMELMQEDDVMQDVRKRRAEASKIFLSFGDDMEGFNRYVEEQTKAFGYRSEPTGHGTTRLVRIEPQQ
ncbi:MAG: hypothetical protein LBR23_06230 [Spirochaetaceae bacterium]|jgi:hypothetical protein|nr:hypothetical protein [Spirochaetaceae bacterium]